jgi:hypothetical protein
MALSSEPGVPHKGWQEIGVIDLRQEQGAFYGEYEDCEFCGHEQIRFVHLLEHSSYPEVLRVGCICACDLTEDYKNPKRREREIRNRAARKERFVFRKWKQTKLGGETIVLDGYRVTVGQIAPGRYRIWINGKEGTRVYDNEITAKLCAFDAVQKMIEKGIF